MLLSFQRVQLEDGVNHTFVYTTGNVASSIDMIKIVIDNKLLEVIIYLSSFLMTWPLVMFIHVTHICMKLLIEFCSERTMMHWFWCTLFYHHQFSHRRHFNCIRSPSIKFSNWNGIKIHTPPLNWPLLVSSFNNRYPTHTNAITNTKQTTAFKCNWNASRRCMQKMPFKYQYQDAVYI